MTQKYEPTETDRLTGDNLRHLRKKAGLTVAQLIETAELPFSESTYSNIENGRRLLDDPTAAKFAAFYGIGVGQVIVKPAEYRLTVAGSLPVGAGRRVVEHLSDREVLALKPAANNPPAGLILPPARPLVIDLDAPMHPEKYRAEVWMPYLEARYAADQIAS